MHRAVCGSSRLRLITFGLEHNVYYYIHVTMGKLARSIVSTEIILDNLLNASLPAWWAYFRGNYIESGGGRNLS